MRSRAPLGTPVQDAIETAAGLTSSKTRASDTRVEKVVDTAPADGYRRQWCGGRHRQAVYEESRPPPQKTTKRSAIDIMYICMYLQEQFYCCPRLCKQENSGRRTRFDRRQCIGVTSKRSQKNPPPLPRHVFPAYSLRSLRARRLLRT